MSEFWYWVAIFVAILFVALVVGTNCSEAKWCYTNCDDQGGCVVTCV